MVRKREGPILGLERDEKREGKVANETSYGDQPII